MLELLSDTGKTVLNSVRLIKDSLSNAIIWVQKLGEISTARKKDHGSIYQPNNETNINILHICISKDFIIAVALFLP